MPPGRERGVLQSGEPLTLEDGRVITPDSVLGPARPGRKVVLTGDTAPAATVVQAAHKADVLVHEATFGADEGERARETLHATAAEAAEVARLADVELLALTHVSTRYFGSELAGEAREVFAETVVPRDFDVIEVPFPERGAPSSSRPVRGPYHRAAMARMVQAVVAGDPGRGRGAPGAAPPRGIEAEIGAEGEADPLDGAGARGLARGGEGRDRGARPSPTTSLLAEP